MSTSNRNRLKSSLQSLPPELKALIVAKVRELDTETEFNFYHGLDEEAYDVDESFFPSMGNRASISSSGDLCYDDEWDAKQDTTSLETLSRRTSRNSAMQSVSLLDRAYASLAFPYLWQHVNLTHRLPEELVEFHDTILPRHREHIQIVKLDAGSLDRLSGAWDHSFQPRVADWTRKARIRFSSQDLIMHWDYILISEILRQLPNINGVVMDFLPYLDIPDVFRLAKDSISTSGPIYSEWFSILKEVGPRMEYLNLDSSMSTRANATEKDLADFLKSFPNLQDLSLSMESLESTGRDILMKVLPAMTKLETLELCSAGFINDAMARQSWCCPLKHLVLQSGAFLSSEAFFEFVRQFRHTLQSLTLQDTPTIISSQNFCEVRIDLPRLKDIDLSHEEVTVDFLKVFDECQLDTITWGCCTEVAYQDFENFVLRHRKSLKTLIISCDATLSEAQLEAIELLCFAKSITIIIVPDKGDFSSSGAYEMDGLEDLDAWQSDEYITDEE